MSQLNPTGPPIVHNWFNWRETGAAAEAYEYPLFTDARITGGHLSLGPYWVCNTIAHASTVERDGLAPALVLRLEDHLPRNVLPQMEKTETGSYHGGYLPDEFAALASLVLGIRLKAGAITRRFIPDGDDPKGTPVAYLGFRHPLLLKDQHRPVLPQAGGAHGLEGLAALNTLPTLPPHDAVALVRAARMYQEAVWIAESAPAMSWLLLVSAIECAANCWDRTTMSRVDRLRASKPELVTALEARSPDLVAVVAEHVADSIGSTKKFLNYMLAFPPPPPINRPPEDFQISWIEADLKKALAKVYDYRSQALHAGVPFPAPMCEAPLTLAADWAAPTEKPFGLATAAQGGVWLAKDLPMHLHVFEHLARGALLRWWNQLVEAPQSGQATRDLEPGT